MKQKKIGFQYCEYKNSELKKSDKELVKIALEAARSAYAPYSGFCVGAAARLESGEIVTGNNQENAAYPSGLCAERVALFNIQSQNSDNTVSEMVVTAIHKGKQTKEPVYPCGACRQVMIEHEMRHKKPLRLLFAGTDCVIEVKSASILLPLNFTGKILRK